MSYHVRLEDEQDRTGHVTGAKSLRVREYAHG